MRRNVVKVMVVLASAVFGLTGCGGGGGSDSGSTTTPSTTTTTQSGLSALYGRLTLNYKFNSSTTTYTDIANFTSANLNSDGEILTSFVVGSSSRAIACRTAPSFRSHMCLILNMNTNVQEMFLFDLNNGQISNGLYEYCSSGVSTSACSSSLILSPDGTAWGTVSSSLAKSIDESNINDDAASKSLHKLDSAGTGAISEVLSSQQQQATEELGAHFEKLSKQTFGVAK